MTRLADGGEKSDETAMWAEIGRRLLHGELAEMRFELEEVFYDAEEALYGEHDGDGEYSGDLAPEHIYAMRSALNRVRERVENEVAPAAGVEPWSDPKPAVPTGVMWELTDHPDADGVDPEDYVNDGGHDE